MSLKPCRECGTEVSTEAKTCPNCGVKRPVVNEGSGGIVVVVLIAIVVVMAAVGGSDDASTPPDAPPVDCLTVPASTVEAIARGLQVSGGGSLGRASAVKSDDFQGVYFVAAEVHGPGLSNTVGVWGVNSLSDPGMIFSAVAMAEEFSQWGRDSRVSVVDHGVGESRQCLRQGGERRLTSDSTTTH